MENTLTVVQPTTDVALSTTLMGLRQSLQNVAQARVDALGAGYTNAERNAMMIVEELRLINGMDLAAILMRGQLLREIEAGALWTVHPGQYGTLQELAKDQGISLSELSNIRDMCEIIFPYIETTMGLAVAEVWEEIGKSNFRELVPVLKALITGEEGTLSVRSSIAAILDDIAATAAASGEALTGEQMRAQAIEWLVQQGQILTNRQLRQAVRPAHAQAIHPAVFTLGDRRMVLIEMDQVQYTAFVRKLGTFMQDEMVMALSDDPNVRQSQLMRVRPLRQLISP